MKAPSLVYEWIVKYRENILLNRMFTVLSIDVLVKVSGIILLPVYLRLMTQEQYGLFGYLLSIILTFSLVLNFGLYIPLSKFYHDYKEPAQRGKLLFTIFSLLLIILLFIIFIIYILGFDFSIVKVLFKNPIDYSHYRISIMLAVIVTVLSFMLTNYFFTAEKIGLIKKYNVVRIVSVNLVTLTLMYFLKETDSVELRLMSTYLIELALVFIFSYFLLKEIRPTFSSNLAISSLKFGAPIMVSAIFGIVINFGDKFFLEKYGTFIDFSNYYLAASCAAIIPMIYTSIQNAWLPAFLKEKNIIKNFHRTKKMVLRLLVFFILLSGAMILFIKILLHFTIIPYKYNEVIYILPFLLLSQIIGSLVNLYTNYLIYFEKTIFVSFTGFFTCFIVFGASILFIPAFGVYGAAIVSIVGNLTYFIIYYFTVKKLSQRYSIQT